MLYLDSAVLVALHCEEATTPGVRRWIVKQREPLAVSDWVLTECVSAFGLKVRRDELHAADAQLAVQSIEQLVEETIEVLPIAAAHYRQARQWLHQFKLGLRAAAALHLAVAHQTDCRLATYDKTLLAVARTLKVRAVKTLG
jgi:predicted nucleic acid-binding protein